MQIILNLLQSRLPARRMLSPDILDSASLAEIAKQVHALIDFVLPLILTLLDFADVDIAKKRRRYRALRDIESA